MRVKYFLVCSCASVPHWCVEAQLLTRKYLTHRQRIHGSLSVGNDSGVMNAFLVVSNQRFDALLICGHPLLFFRSSIAAVQPATGLLPYMITQKYSFAILQGRTAKFLNYCPAE